MEYSALNNSSSSSSKSKTVTYLCITYLAVAFLTILPLGIYQSYYSSNVKNTVENTKCDTLECADDSKDIHSLSKNVMYTAITTCVIAVIGYIVLTSFYFKNETSLEVLGGTAFMTILVAWFAQIAIFWMSMSNTLHTNPKSNINIKTEEEVNKLYLSSLGGVFAYLPIALIAFYVTEIANKN